MNIKIHHYLKVQSEEWPEKLHHPSLSRWPRFEPDPSRLIFTHTSAPYGLDCSTSPLVPAYYELLYITIEDERNHHILASVTKWAKRIKNYPIAKNQNRGDKLLCLVLKGKKLSQVLIPSRKSWYKWSKKKRLINSGTISNYLMLQMLLIARYFCSLMSHFNGMNIKS